MIRNFVLGLALFAGIPSIAVADYRCSWLYNPSADQYQFIDKSATWTIMQRGGYRLAATSMKNLPEQSEAGYVRTNGRYGYSCSCLSVTTDTQNRRITAIEHKGKQVLLKRCLEDKGIVAPPFITSQFNRPSSQSSYTDSPVIGNGVAISQAAEPRSVYVGPDTGYYDSPQVTASSQPSFSNQGAESASNYYVQVIVTSMQAKAMQFKGTFEKAGYKTVINSFMRGGKSLHKVKVGPYASRWLAVNSQTKLRQSFAKNQSVQKSIIVR